MGRQRPGVGPDDETARQTARREVKQDGDRSSRLARDLMKLSEPRLAKLVIDDDLRDCVERARKVTQQVARRRAERTLAGDLRRFDLMAVEVAIADLDR